jgi:hypothetical protein
MNQNYFDPVARRRSFAIISHPDAGKMTLTEKLLLFGGAIQLAGEVRAKVNRLFLIDNLLFSGRLIEGVLRLSGFYWQGRRNACTVRVKHNDIVSRRIPRSFDGFRILHLSDLHIEMSGPAMSRVLELLAGTSTDNRPA